MDSTTCRLHVVDETATRARCDDQSERAFANADLLSPGCPPLDNLDRIQRAVADQAQAVLVGNVSAPPCQEVLSGTDGLVTCVLHKSGANIGTTAASLWDILTQIHNEDSSTCGACASVTTSTPLWLQAWGGKGGNRGKGALAGKPGFAQTITTLSDLEGTGTVVLYYYLGDYGGWNNTTGASGGAATLVTKQELQLNPASDPTDALLIAAGGGGSGGCDGGCSLGCPEPGSGGAGGIAISTTGPDGQGVGQGGDGSDSGGNGGGQGVGGGGNGGAAGKDGIGGRGGGGWGGGGGGPHGNSVSSAGGGHVHGVVSGLISCAVPPQ